MNAKDSYDSHAQQRQKVYYVIVGKHETEGKNMSNEYTKQAKEFLAKHNATMTIEFEEQVYNPWGDYANHNAYNVTIERNGDSFTINFNDSAYNTGRGIKPTEYDILTTIEKYGYESYKEFCEECCYEGGEESLAIYQAVQEEYENVERLFGDCMEELREIC